ncbi:MAG TPA: lipopolysaccharide assembly protein LapA domain-containing protein [Paucimonas sp.]|nr:lipopolysaccharide assembly protein LapA domain-containing protein [Paucimonas sp.]
MKILSRIVGVILFVIFFGFALKNTQEAALQFFLGYEIRGPLVLLLLGFFAAGAALGVLAMTPTVFRHRRELSKYRKAVADLQKEGEARQLARTQPPQPDSIASK